MTKDLADELERLATEATPGKWYHCQPFKTVPEVRTVHGRVPAERVDYVSTWPGPGTPPGHRTVIDMPGRESRTTSEDMALIAFMKSNLPAILSALRGEQWQGIETAPKDSSRVMLWLPESATGRPARATEGRFAIPHEGAEDARGWWQTFDGMVPQGIPGSPTHWRPLPPPPKGTTHE